LKQRAPKLNISEADIRAAYHQGEDAIALLVQGLLSRIEQTESCLDKLEKQQQKDSRNSSKPPSGDGFKKRTKSLRKKSGRPRGSQKGIPAAP